jgi:hypothetical protein
MAHFSRFARLALAATLLAASSAHANKITQDGVDDVSLTVQGSIFEVTIKDFSGGTSVAAVDIRPVTTHLTFPMESRVKCGKNSGGYSHMNVGFGAFNPTFGDTLVMHSEPNPEAGYTEWAGGQWVSQAAFTHNFQVALSALKNPAYPDYELDPVAEFNKAMDQFVSQGGTKLDFLRENRTIEVQRKLTALGACWMGFSGKALGTINTTVTIRIRYQGNPNLSNLNVAIGQQQGGIQVGETPLQIISGEILPYASNYAGACPAELKFRVRLTAAGKGELRYQINEGGSTVYQSPTLVSSGGEITHDFTFALPAVGNHQLNQVQQRTFTLHARGKDQNDNFWPAHWQYYGNKGWSFKCTPQVSIGVGGVGPGGGVNLAPMPPGGGTPTPGTRINAPATTPVPPTPGFAAPAGSQPPPAPRPQVAPAPNEPSPSPQLMVAPVTPDAPPEPPAPQLNVAPVAPDTPPAKPTRIESSR